MRYKVGTIVAKEYFVLGSDAAETRNSGPCPCVSNTVMLHILNGWATVTVRIVAMLNSEMAE
jgi:hypothetical protein